MKAKMSTGVSAGDDELRQVLAEVHLELLDALDQRQHHVARARAREVRRAQRERRARAPSGAGAPAPGRPCGGRPSSAQ